MPDWQRLVRAHLPPLPLRPEREAEIVEELAQLLEDAYVESGHTASESEPPDEAELADWVTSQVPEWSDLASEIQRVEKPLQSRLPIPQPPPERPKSSGTRRALVMNTFTSDVRYALRTLGKNPGFTALAVLTLALGIGINSAVFSVVNAMVLRPLPVAAPEELASIYATEPHASGLMGHQPMAWADYQDFAEQSDNLEDILAYCFSRLVLDDGQENHYLFGELVTGNYFEALGVPILLGRALTPEDDRDSSAVTVLSHGAWQRHFGGDPSVLGRTLRINSQPTTVVGVASASYPGLMPGLSIDAWVPVRAGLALGARPDSNFGVGTPGLDRMADRNRRWLWALGRLKPGVSFKQASAEIETRAAQFARQYPDTNQDRGFVLVPAAKTLPNPYLSSVASAASMVLMAMVGLVLLIVCANLANMLLARALFRRKEIATRLALGASRGQVLRQLLTESVILALLGGGLGLLVAVVAHQVLGTLQVTPYAQTDFGLKLDRSVLTFTFGIATLTGMIFGLTPALASMDGNLATTLREGRGAGSGLGRRRLRGALVVTQVALALLLLICAGLSLRSMENARRIDPGFEARGIATANLVTPPKGITTAQVKDFYDRFEERVGSMGAVRSFAYASRTPLSLFEFSTQNLVPATNADQYGDNWPRADTADVGPNYFATMEIPLVSGREFNERDTLETPRVAIINETLAETFWPGEPAVGQGLTLFGEDQSYEVVGVAKDSKYRSLGEGPRLFAYLAMGQRGGGNRSLLVRADGSLQATLAQVRQVSRDLDPRMAILNLRTLEQAVAPAMMPPRASAILFSIFGLTGLLLAATGIYGVISYMVSQRTHEIGIRMAMGAGRANIVRLMVRDGVVMTLIGIAVGLIGAAWATRLLASILYGISATDVLTFVAVSLFLALVAFGASYLPARRASKVDPLVALRYE